MAFNILTRKRVACVGQDQRINDRIGFNLRGEERLAFWQRSTEKFYFPAVRTSRNPLVAWHFRTPSGAKSRFQIYFRLYANLSVGGRGVKEAVGTQGCTPRHRGGGGYGMLLVGFFRVAWVASSFSSLSRADLVFRGIAISLAMLSSVTLASSSRFCFLRTCTWWHQSRRRAVQFGTQLKVIAPRAFPDECAFRGRTPAPAPPKTAAAAEECIARTRITTLGLCTSEQTHLLPVSNIVVA